MLFDQRTDFVLVLATVNGSLAIVTPDAVPVCRLYGPGGHVGEATVAYLATADISDVDSDGDTGSRLTAAGHPFQVGDVLAISGVLGATGVNGTATVVARTDDTFDIAAAPGGAYISGGVAVSKGLFAADIDADLRNLLEPGVAYTAVWRYAVSAAAAAVAQPFGVM